MTSATIRRAGVSARTSTGPSVERTSRRSPLRCQSSAEGASSMQFARSITIPLARSSTASASPCVRPSRPAREDGRSPARHFGAVRASCLRETRCTPVARSTISAATATSTNASTKRRTFVGALVEMIPSRRTFRDDAEHHGGDERGVNVAAGEVDEEAGERGNANITLDVAAATRSGTCIARFMAGTFKAAADPEHARERPGDERDERPCQIRTTS